MTDSLSFYIEIDDVLWFVWGGGHPPKNHFLLAQPLAKHAGWKRAGYVSNSGKTVFICETCGRHSQTPDKHCPIGHTVLLTEYLKVEPIQFTEEGYVSGW